MTIGDFHLHTTASDGVCSPAQVVGIAHERGLRHIAITDHDTTDGLAEATAVARDLGVQLIPGIELSTDLGRADVHLLGFGFDVQAQALQDFLAWQREGRLGRTRRIVEILGEHGMAIDLSRVLEIAGEATVGRPHVAQALVERRHVTSIQEAFDLWLGNGKPADVDRPKLPPAEAIAMIHDHGGLVFVAHPVFIADHWEPALDDLVTWGVDGVETFYKNYDEAMVSRHRRYAGEHSLATSGGSDYHGLGNPDDREIGDIPFPDEEVRRFLTFLKQREVNTNLAGGRNA